MKFRVVLQVEQFVIKGIWTHGPNPVVLLDTNDEEIAIAEVEKIKVLVGREIGYQRISKGE